MGPRVPSSLTAVLKPLNLLNSIPPGVCTISAILLCILISRSCFHASEPSALNDPLAMLTNLWMWLIKSCINDSDSDGVGTCRAFFKESVESPS